VGGSIGRLQGGGRRPGVDGEHGEQQLGRVDEGLGQDLARHVAHTREYLRVDGELVAAADGFLSRREGGSGWPYGAAPGL